MSAWGLFEVAGDKELVTNHYMDDIDSLVEQIEVIKAFYHTDEETIYLESCMFKIKSDFNKM